MIVKCPRCEHEFDLELETCVVEMLFECPDCKTKFMVGNTDDHPAKKAVETKPEPEPVQQTTDAVQPQKEEKESSGCIVKLLRFILICIVIWIIASIYESKKGYETVIKGTQQLIDNLGEQTAPEVDIETIKVSEEDIYTRVYKDGYKVGYTIDDETYKLWGGEGYFRSLWGLYATYDMLQNDALYKEYRRGLLDGMAKRRGDTGRGTNYY